MSEPDVDPCSCGHGQGWHGVAGPACYAQGCPCVEFSREKAARGPYEAAKAARRAGFIAAALERKAKREREEAQQDQQPPHESLPPPPACTSPGCPGVCAGALAGLWCLVCGVRAYA